jgi:hypothetical protein
MSVNEKLYCLYAASVSIGMIVINLISIYGGGLS